LHFKVDFTDEPKTLENSQPVTEQLLTGVWYLQNKDVLEYENMDEANGEGATTSDVFVINIPQKYHDHPDIIEAKSKELEKWKTYDAYVEVNQNDMQILGSRLVVQERNGKPKARFVVKGCQEKLNPRSYSPTASKESFKLFLSIAANEGFVLKSLDVTSAFMQGRPLKREIYIEPPPEKANPYKAWKLKKSCYGLYDASRQWFMAVRETLLSMEMKSLICDDAVFYCLKDGKLIGTCVLHVEDFLIGGTRDFHHTVKEKLVGRLTFETFEFGSFKFTGLSIKQTSEGTFADQIEYIQSLEPIKLDKFADKSKNVRNRKSQNSEL
jgi:hypothetical protein